MGAKFFGQRERFSNGCFPNAFTFQTNVLIFEKIRLKTPKNPKPEKFWLKVQKRFAESPKIIIKTNIFQKNVFFPEKSAGLKELNFEKPAEKFSLKVRI